MHSIRASTTNDMQPISSSKSSSLKVAAISTSHPPLKSPTLDQVTIFILLLNSFLLVSSTYQTFMGSAAAISALIVPILVRPQWSS